MNYIGADAAKNMAAADAQVDTANASFSGANLGEKNGLSYYQVDFTANGREYHYAIDAMTGTVIESSSAASAQQTTGTGQQTATAGQQAAAAGQVDENRLPRHIAVIMDGNGRWAKRRGLPRTAGHKVGAEVFRKIATYCKELGVEYLTVYAFSTENWKRPADEVNTIMGLLKQMCIRDR